MESEISISGRLLVLDANHFFNRLTRNPFTPVKNNVKTANEYYFICNARRYLLQIQKTKSTSNSQASAIVIIKPCFESVKNEFSDNDILNVCQFLSEEFSCKAYFIKGVELYGQINVFNGGSDYEVINETWFYCAYDSGKLLFQKSTEFYNDEFRQIEEQYLKSSFALELGDFLVSQL